MKRVRRFIWIFLVLILSFMTYKYIVYKNYKADNGPSEQQIVKVFQQNESPLILENAFSFKWTEAYIFGPYTSEEDIRKTIKVKWIPQYSFIEYLFGNEDTSLLNDQKKKIIFINNDRVVKDIMFYRSDFDINENYMISNDKLILTDSKSHTYSK